MNLFQRIFVFILFCIYSSNSIYSCHDSFQGFRHYYSVIDALYNQTEYQYVHDIILEGLKSNLDSTERVVHDALQQCPIIQQTPQLLRSCSSYVEYRKKNFSKSELLQEDKALEGIIASKNSFKILSSCYPLVLRNLMIAFSRQALAGSIRGDIISKLKAGSRRSDKEFKDVMIDILLSHQGIQATVCFKSACKEYMNYRRSVQSKSELAEFDLDFENFLKMDKKRYQKSLFSLFDDINEI